MVATIIQVDSAFTLDPIIRALLGRGGLMLAIVKVQTRTFPIAALSQSL